MSEGLAGIPISAESWFRRGNDYAEQDNLEQAEYAYRQALKQGPHAKALHNLGLVQVRLGVKALRDARSQLAASDTKATQAATREFLHLLLQSAF